MATGGQGSFPARGSEIPFLYLATMSREALGPTQLPIPQLPGIDKASAVGSRQLISTKYEVICTCIFTSRAARVLQTCNRDHYCACNPPTLISEESFLGVNSIKMHGLLLSRHQTPSWYYRCKPTDIRSPGGSRFSGTVGRSCRQIGPTHNAEVHLSQVKYRKRKILNFYGRALIPTSGGRTFHRL
jgi:hypothetical protein